MSRRTTRRLGLLAGTLAALAAPTAAHAAAWQFAPAVAPPTPPNASSAPFGIPVGQVGDLSFWAPNRGLLITRGNNLVPMGLYAYDGVSWHQLSTVCGGTDGRIAWAGPDEFWTIADQRPGQVTASAANLADISLCHFKDGQVVASYAMPLQQSDSYLPMDAAACRNPNDCWFGGDRLASGGAFHLHWDGSTVSVFISSQDHNVAAMANVGGTLFESVDSASADASENPLDPPVLHTIVTGAPDPFQSVLPAPDFGTGTNGTPVDPTTQAPLQLSSDGSQLWAVAGAAPFSSPGGGLARAGPLILRYAGGAWSQLTPESGRIAANEQPAFVAPQPGTSSAWISLDPGDGSTVLAHMDADGTVDDRVQLGPDQNVGARGAPGPIACPATNDCWATTSDGWLFHYTDGTTYPQDTDPNFAGVISFRPSDSGVPIVLPDSPPPDDSLANQATIPPPVVKQPKPRKPKPRKVVKKAPLVTKVKTSVVHRTTVQMAFTLTSRAHFQLVAQRKGKTVAKTRAYVLARGRHTVKLKLNPKRWPTKFSVKATVFKAKPTKTTSRSRAKSPSSSNKTTSFS